MINTFQVLMDTNSPFVSILSDYALRLDNVSQPKYREMLILQVRNSTIQINDPYVLKAS